jgi:hypothetical protein
MILSFRAIDEFNMKYAVWQKALQAPQGNRI